MCLYLPSDPLQDPRSTSVNEYFSDPRSAKKIGFTSQSLCRFEKIVPTIVCMEIARTSSHLSAPCGYPV